MVIRRSVSDPTYVLDFLLMKSRQVWPAAVLLDASCDVHYCHRTRSVRCSYGFDIFPSEGAVITLLSDEDSPPYLNICVEGPQVVLSGDETLMQHVLNAPLWIKP